MMFVWIMFVVLLIMLLGSFPAWPYSKRWGYAPTAIIAILLVAFLCMWMWGWLPNRGHQPWMGGHQMRGAPMHR